MCFYVLYVNPVLYTKGLNISFAFLHHFLNIVLIAFSLLIHDEMFLCFMLLENICYCSYVIKESWIAVAILDYQHPKSSV